MELGARPLALTGFMGAGKTEVGRRLGERLGRPFYDTDAYVEEQAGRSVPSFFPDQEAVFRKLEAEAVAALVERGPTVIALGGGAVLNPATLALLKERALLVHLHLPWAELRPELPALLATRPLLRNRSEKEIRELYEARLERYREAAITVTIGRAGPDAAAEAVLRALASTEEKVTKFLHVTTRKAWESARGLGLYEGDTLETEGFIHCCTSQQLEGVLDRYFNPRPEDLIVLTVDAARVTSEIRWENGFPHVYGPLDIEAVSSAAPVTG